MKQKQIDTLYLANPKNNVWYAGFVFENEEEEPVFNTCVAEIRKRKLSGML